MSKDLMIVKSYDEIERAAGAMSQSGYFKDANDRAKAIAKILAGQEMGFGPFASMTGVSIIQGKPVVGANLLASAVKASGKYNYRIVEHSNTICKIVFYELFNGEWNETGESVFTIQDAQSAGLTTKDNWKKYPRNMLFARALSNGMKWYAPDACNGATVYTPDELGADVDEDGDVIDIEPVEVVESEPEPTPEDDSPRYSWKSEIVDAANEGYHFEHSKHAVNWLNKTGFTPETATPEKIKKLATAYANIRPDHEDSDEAMKVAIAEVKKGSK